MANPQSFIDQYGGLADTVGGQIGVDPSILLGQWGLETGWGKSVIPGTNNLGNIKGPGVAAIDNATGSNDQYRAYASPDEFGQDFAGLLGRRYVGALNAGQDAQKYATALKAGGYAEDPDYAAKLVAAADTVRGMTGARGVLNRFAGAIFPSASAATTDDIFGGAITGTSRSNRGAKADDIFGGALTAAKPVQQDPKSMLGMAAPVARPDQPLSGGNIFNRQQPNGAPEGTGQYATDVPAPAVTPGPVGDQRAAPVPQGTGEPPAPPPERSFLDEAGRQVGLTARYGLEGLGNTAQIFTEPVRRFLVNPISRAFGGPDAQASGQTMTTLADTLGLPSPETKQERIVGDVTRLMAGTGGLAGAAKGVQLLSQAAAPIATASAPITAGTVAGNLAANPAGQIGAAIGSGTAGGLAKENGANGAGQFLAALGGGILGGVGTNAAGSLVDAARNAWNRATIGPASLEVRFNNLLQDAGVNPSTLPDGVARSLRAEMESSLRAGREMRPDAVRRLAEFRTVGATPTRGTITQDPIQITREQNLAKIAANSSDSTLSGLPQIQNQNNATLIRYLNNAGAGTAPDAVATGETVMGSLGRTLGAQKDKIDSLYAGARDSAGRSFPLDGASFTSRAAQALDDNLLGHALPDSIRTKLNDIALGKVPFTVDYAEQLKTVMGKLQRATADGQTRMAIGAVRSALDDTPVLGLGEQTAAQGARAVNPGNLPAIPNAPALGEDAIAAFNQARAANRSMMQGVEASPALKAVYEGTATPDQFMNKFVIGKGATIQDVAKLREGLGADQAAVNAVRGHIVDWLKGRALNGASDEVGKFSSSAYRKALDSIGERKLAQFFSPEEITGLRSAGRVAEYMQAQPVGSAVNNSNSGALLAGRGYDLLRSVAGKIPFGDAALLSPLRNIEVSIRQRNAQNILPGLLAEGMRAQRPVVGSQYLLPGAAALGLLAAPTVPGR